MKLPERFFDSTRGRIILLLRGTTGTVGELAEKLGLTDNAVRAHLLSLERDGLLRQAGLQRGHRKPHFAYELTLEAERFFPRAYDTVFNRLITVLKEKLSRKELNNALRKVGVSLAAGREAVKASESLESRAKKAVEVLGSLGGAAKIEKEDGKVFIQSSNCPLAAVVAEHPEGCRIAEALVSEITAAKVTERCEKTAFPRCRFQISEA
jgi:predicted ArsR family transcriptional regulator